jgi:hypothetical protein
MTRLHRLFGASALAASLTALPVAAQTPPITYGTLDNFDVINDTGGETHGFEIELEGIAPADVAYAFGAPNIRYGDPTISPTLTGGVIVRWAASYDAITGTWNTFTPIAIPPYLPTDGHSCWMYGVPDPAIYIAAGCDHFGLSLNAAPTKTTYRWLVVSSPGTLVPFGTNVSVPAPTWNVTPPAAPGAQPVVAAVISAPDPTLYEFGDALWAKVFVTELSHDLQAGDLNHMVIDDPDNVNIVPNEPAEVEVEWVLVQKSVSGVQEQEFGGGAEVGAGNEAVSRRFEFYKYTGQYDQETHEALCDNPLAADQQVPARCGYPDKAGVAGVGDLIGTQNVAINLAGEFPSGSPNRPPVAACSPVTVAADPVSCSVPVSVDNGSYDPDADAINLSQSPTGPYSVGSTNVTLTVTDSHQATASCSVPVTVYDDVAPTPGTATATPNQLLKGDGKMVPVAVTVVGTHDACDAAPSCKLTGVTSTEPKDPGAPDWQITGDLSVLLRNQPKGTGRTYSIIVECRDASDNATTTTATVTVPK